MALENFTWLDSMVDTNPVPGDPVDQGDDHLRGIKEAVLFNLGGLEFDTRLKVNSTDALVVTRAGAEAPVMDMRGESGAPKFGIGNVLAGDDLYIDNDTPAGLIKFRGDAGAIDLVTLDPVALLATFDVAITSTGNVTAVNLIATSQASAAAAAPTLDSHLTRKDYVDAVGDQVAINTGDIATNAAAISANAGNIAANTAGLADISDSTGQQQIRVGNMQMLGGSQAVVGSFATVVFSVPFTSTPAVTFSPNLGGHDPFFTAISNTGFQVQSSGGIIYWNAIGSNTA